MGLLAIVKLFLVVFGNIITILTGVLFINHRELLSYFKDTFTFIKDDYNPPSNIKHMGLFPSIGKVIKSSFNLLGDGASIKENELNEEFGVNQILVLIGQVLIISGILGMVLMILGTIWMISESQINVNLY